MTDPPTGAVPPVVEDGLNPGLMDVSNPDTSVLTGVVLVVAAVVGASVTPRAAATRGLSSRARIRGPRTAGLSDDVASTGAAAVCEPWDAASQQYLLYPWVRFDSRRGVVQRHPQKLLAEDREESSVEFVGVLLSRRN